MLTAHQIIAIRRRFPDAKVSPDHVRIEFPSGDIVSVIPGILDDVVSVSSINATPVERVLDEEGQLVRINILPAESEEALAAEKVLRGLLGEAAA